MLSLIIPSAHTQPTHYCYDMWFDPCRVFMSLVIARVFSQTSWETGRDGLFGWIRDGATGSGKERRVRGFFFLSACLGDKVSVSWWLISLLNKDEASRPKWTTRREMGWAEERVWLSGILIKTLIVMVRAQRQNKNTGEELRWSEDWTVMANREWLSDEWAPRWGAPDTYGLEEMITVAEKGQYAAN